MFQSQTVPGMWTLSSSSSHFFIHTHTSYNVLGNFLTGCISPYNLSCDISKHGSSCPPFEFICIPEAGQPF